LTTERFNRQFIMLDFEDLDDPEFMEFVRSSEFSTYLVMRRFIWRSDTPHRLGLHEYYAQGSLACALSREKIAEKLGNITGRQVTRDINALVTRGMIQSVRTGRGNVFILGKWVFNEEDQVYYEYFFLDRLHVRVDKNVQSEWTSNENPLSGQKCPIRVDKNVQSEWTKMSTNNIEENIEENRERDLSNTSKDPSNLSISSSTELPEEDYEDLTSAAFETLMKTCSREFDDLEHLASNITRGYNLWAETDLDEAGMLAKVEEARKVTKARISRSSIRERAKKMPYFFAVLEDLLGLKKKE